MAMLHAARIQRGGATIETAIVLPVFMMAVLALSSLIGYPAAWLRVETAVCDATRLLASGGYAAQLCGLLTVRGDADALAQGGSVIGKPQLEALSALLAALSAPDSGGEAAQGRQDAAGLEFIRTAGGALSADLGRGIASLSDEALGQMALALASWRLSSAYGGACADPWAAVGVRGGKTAVSFSNSHYDSGNGQIEIVADYSLKPASPFGLCPAIRCRNKVRIALWGAGVGKSLRGSYATGGMDGDAGAGIDSNSLWNHPGDPASAWRRGQQIESAELARLSEVAARKGSSLLRLDTMQTGCDALVRNGDGAAEALQVISLNPLLASYRDNPAAVRRAVLSELARMPETGEPLANVPAADEVPVGLRQLVLVVPENAPAWIETLASDLMGTLSRESAVLSVRRGYGVYGDAEPDAERPAASR